MGTPQTGVGGTNGRSGSVSGSRPLLRSGLIFFLKYFLEFHFNGKNA